MRTEFGTGACRIHHQRVSFDPLSFKFTLSVDFGDFQLSSENYIGFRTFGLSLIKRVRNDVFSGLTAGARSIVCIDRNDGSKRPKMIGALNGGSVNTRYAAIEI